MKIWMLPIATVLCGIAGCAPETPETTTSIAPPQSEAVQAEPVQLTTEQELAKYCRVCVVDKGEKIEEYFPSRLDTKHDGHTYKFCADDCKQKFDTDPKKYALKS